MEEGGSSGDNNGEEASKVTPASGEDCHPQSGNCNPESGDCHSESGNRNPDSSSSNPSKENDRQGEEPVPMDVPTKDVTKLVLGAECAVFEKPENPGAHMKPLFIRGHLDRMPIRHMLIDGGAM
jgi:hypothetical protein